MLEIQGTPWQFNLMRHWNIYLNIQRLKVTNLQKNAWKYFRHDLEKLVVALRHVCEQHVSFIINPRQYGRVWR
jgi:hypothetical protein